MEEEEAHQLYQQFQRTDAAAKQKQGLGFGSSAASPPVVDKSQKSAGWEAPYELSDKFEQAPEITTSKRSRSSHHHKHTPEKRHRAHGSSSPGRSSHQDHDRTAHHRQSGKEQPTRHHSSREVREEHHQPSSQSRKRRSVSPDDRHHRQNHRSSSQPESKRDSSRHTSRREQSSHTQHERHGHHRSSDLHHRQHHTSRSRSGAATSSGIAPKAPDYAKLIVGYKYMSDASRLKAVTAYKLRKTSAKDDSRQDGKPWTRFVFNNEALLEEEGAAPDGPDHEGQTPAGLGAFDFRPHRSAQISKPAEDAHEAAIFGAPAVQPLPHSLLAASGSDSDEQPQVVELQEEEAAQLPSTIVSDAANAPALLEPATAGAPKVSWRERALLKKQQQMIT